MSGSFSVLLEALGFGVWGLEDDMSRGPYRKKSGWWAPWGSLFFLQAFNRETKTG